MKTVHKIDKAGEELPQGKRRLIQAAIKLSAEYNVNLSTLGVRQLGREAGLNANTFYRHFKDMEELALAVGQELTAKIMSGMQKVREESRKHADATEGAAEYFLQEVECNPDVFRMGLRELHGGSAPMRANLRSVMEDFARLSVQQIEAGDLVPGLGRNEIYFASLNITYYMFYRSLDYLDNPDKRDTIKHEIIRFIRIQFLGSAID